MIEKWGKEDTADDKESGGSSDFEELQELLTQLSGKLEEFKLAKGEKLEQGKPKKAKEKQAGTFVRAQAMIGKRPRVEDVEDAFLDVVGDTLDLTGTALATPQSGKKGPKSVEHVDLVSCLGGYMQAMEAASRDKLRLDERRLGLDERRIAVEEEKSREEQKDRQLDREERAANTALTHGTMKA
ncbi:hypothetical protein CYMTET_7039 [Cymbomonas tetramitiformis]|uniref:Uncharacterized protein n=1 Tax=Cymbomonas tetramitiformis TaxID=36881 RepID=A0AAE0GVT7_9CHLO|nr:hypothetical protein CYMTET_7039 [Cymbomonas tetramitiformis]